MNSTPAAIPVRCLQLKTFQSMIAEQLKKFFDPFVCLNIQVWEKFEKLGEVQNFSGTESETHLFRNDIPLKEKKYNNRSFRSSLVVFRHRL